MYGSENTLTIAKVLLGIIISLILVLLSKLGAFQQVYDLGANIFKDFQFRHKNCQVTFKSKENK